MQENKSGCFFSEHTAVFPSQTVWQYSDRDAPDVECRRY